MRLRNENLRTGSLLTYFSNDERLRNRSLLFLLEGAEDVEPLTRVEAVCRELIDEMSPAGAFEWQAVADQGGLTDVDPCLDLGRVFRLEAVELAGVEEGALRSLFQPVIDRLVADLPELFPSAGGAVGGPAEGLQLLGRAVLAQELDARLVHGESVYLTAPRRSGKTSVLLQLEKVARGVRAIYVDLERARDERHAVALLRARILGESPRAALAAAGEDWVKDLGRCLAEFAGRESTPPAVLLDELVFFVRGLKNGKEQLWRRRVQGFLAGLAKALEASGCRLVVSGSTDLFDSLREELGIERDELPALLHGLHRVRLPLLAVEPLELRRLLLGTGLVLEPQELRWLEENLDLSLPYPAMLFLDHLVAQTRRNVAPAGAQALEAVLDTFLAQTSAFHDFQDRLHRRASERVDLREVVYKLLDRLTVRSLSSRELEADILDAADRLWFVETYPVLIEADSVTLASKLFSRWWRLAGG